MGYSVCAAPAREARFAAVAGPGRAATSPCPAESPGSRRSLCTRSPDMREHEGLAVRQRKPSERLPDFAERRVLDGSQRLVGVLQHLARLEQRPLDDVDAGRSRLAFYAAQKDRSQDREGPQARGAGATELVEA